MDIIVNHNPSPRERAEQLSSDKPVTGQKRSLRFLGRYQLKIALSYLAIIAVMLILLNTSPVWISQNFMFDYTRTAMTDRASLFSNTLSALENFTAEGVGYVMAVLDNQAQYRTVVCDHEGKVVYDNLPAGAVVGQYALVGEVYDALSGADVFRSVYKNAAFDSRCAMPVISHGEVIGAVYLSRYDTAQGVMLFGLQSNLFTVSMVIFFIVIVFGVFISMALTRRISAILRGIRAAYGGNYAALLPVRGKDELTELSERLNQLFQILHKTEGLRQQFVSNASHELRTPLAAVRLLTDSILGTPDMPVETVREFVADIGEETERLGRMTEKLMLLSKLETMPSFIVTVNPAPVIRRAAHMLEPLAVTAGVTLRCELAEDCLISGSEDDLYQIVFNLMDNAVKYNKPDGVVQALCFRHDVQAHIVIVDTGVGIPEEELPRIFDRFYRVDKARSRTADAGRPAGGTGLGLSIAAETAARMGGELSVESVLGKGSRFTLKFPLAREEA